MKNLIVKNYISSFFCCALFFISLNSSEGDSKELTKEEKAVVKGFVTKKLKRASLIYQAAFSDDTTAFNKLTKVQQTIVSFLKTFESPKLRELVFFLICEVPDLDKIFKSYDGAEIVGGFFTTSKQKGFDEKNPLDATFKRLITSAEGVLNIINTLDDEGRAQLSSLLQMVQPFVSSLVNVQKEDFFKKYCKSDVTEEGRKIIDDALSNPELNIKQKMTIVRQYLLDPAISEDDFKAMVGEWKALVLTDGGPADVSFFLANKALVDKAVEKFGDKPKIERSVEFFRANGIEVTQDELKRMWPTLGRLKKVFGFIGKAKSALGLQHSLTNAARFFKGRKAVDFKEGTIASSEEFSQLFKDSWLEQARKIGQGKTGKLFWAAAARGAQGISDFINQVRSGKLREKGSEVAQDLALLAQESVADGSAQQGELTVTQIIEKYALGVFQKTRAKLGKVQRGLLGDQGSIVAGNVGKAVKKTVATVLETFQGIFDEVVTSSFGQDKSKYYGAVTAALAEGEQSPVDETAQMKIIMRYVESQPVDIKEVLAALTKMSAAQIKEEFGEEYQEDTIYKMLAFLKIAQVVNHVSSQNTEEFLKKLQDGTLSKTLDRIVETIKKQAKNSKQKLSMDFFELQLDSDEVVKVIVDGLQKDIAGKTLSVTIPSLVEHAAVTTPVVTKEPEQPAQQEEDDTQDDAKQNFFKMDLDQFNDVYLTHFSSVNALSRDSASELSGNPVVDVLRTFPRKLRSLAFSLVSLGSAKDIFENVMVQPGGKKKVGKVVMAAIKAAFGGTKPQDRDPLVNYMKSSLDAGFTLLNVLETATPEDKKHLVSMFELLKPVMELAMSAKLSTLYTALNEKLAANGLSAGLAQEEFNKKSTADKMKFLTAYFAKNSNSSLEEVFKSFNDIAKITAKIDGATFFIQYQKEIEEALKESNPQLYLAQRLGKSEAEIAKVWPEARQIKKYLWWATKARSFVRGVQKLCNFFRRKPVQFDYQKNQYENAQELTEDIKASPVGNIMKFLQETTTGKFITAETKSLGKKIIWVLQADGSGAVTARVNELVADLKGKGMSAQKIQPLIEFVQQFVPKEKVGKAFGVVKLGLQKVETLPGIGEAARAVLDALEDVKTFFTQSISEEGAVAQAVQAPEVTPEEKLDTVSIALGMLTPGEPDDLVGEDLVEEGGGDSGNPLIQAAQKRGDGLSKIERAMKAMAQEAEYLAAVAAGKSPSSGMSQEGYDQKLYDLCALKVRSMLEDGLNDDEYQKVVKAVTQAVQKAGSKKRNNAVAGEVLEVQLVDFSQKLDSAENQKIISAAIDKVMKKILKDRVTSEPKQLPQELNAVVEKPEKSSPEEQALQHFKDQIESISALKTRDAVVVVEGLVEAFSIEYAEKNPALYVSLMHDLVGSITPGIKANSDAIKRSKMLYEAFKKGAILNEEQDSLSINVKQWIQKVTALGERYLAEVDEYEKALRAKAQIKFDLIKTMIQRYKDDQIMERALEDNETFDEDFAITGVERFKELLANVGLLVKVTSVSDDLVSEQLELVVNGLMRILKDSPSDLQNFLKEAIVETVKKAGNKKLKGVLDKAIVDFQQNETNDLDDPVIGSDGDSSFDVTSLRSERSAVSGVSTATQRSPKGQILDTVSTKSGGSAFRGMTPAQAQEEERRRMEEQQGKLPGQVLVDRVPEEVRV